MGDEVGHLEQAVGVGASEGGASDDVLYGDVPGPLAVLSDLVPAGDGVAAPEPVVEAGDHLLAALVEDEESVAARRRDGGVHAVEQPVEAGPLVALDVGLAQADVDHLDAADGPGGVLDDAQPAGEDFGPLVRSESVVGAALVGQLAASGQQVAGVQLPVDRDGVAFPQLEPLVEDALVEVVPPLGVHAQGGPDVVAGTLGLVDVVQPHGVRSPVLDWIVASWGSGKSGSQPSPGASHARPSGPSRSRRPRWETSRGRAVLVLTISSTATRRKWVTANSSSKTTRTAGFSPWSSMGRWEE